MKSCSTMAETRRHLVAACVLAILCIGSPSPGAVPEGGLDYGMEGLPIPAPVFVNQTSPRTVALLVEAFAAEKVPFRRVQFVRELGESRKAEAVPTVVAALSDADDRVRLAAADAIYVLATEDSRSQTSRDTLLNNADAISRLKKLIADADPGVRSAALRALSRVELKGEAVNAALKATDQALLSAAVDCATSAEEGQTLLGRLSSVPEPLRPRALAAIGRTGPPAAAQQLAQLATGTMPLPELASACQAMGMLSSADVLPRLTELLGHSHSVVRREAMLALGKCATAETSRQLSIRMLGDSDATVRQAAATVLGRVLTAEVAPALIPHLADPYQPLWRASRDALEHAPAGPVREKVIQLAGELLDNADPRRREDGSYLLGRFRSDHRYERHLQLLTDENLDLMCQVAESLGLIGRQEARAGIVALAHVADAPHAGKKIQAGVKAMIAGGRLGASELIPECMSVLAKIPPGIYPPARTAAVFVIGVTATADSPPANSLYAVLQSSYDGPSTKFEAVKALGNLRQRDALEQFAGFRDSKTAPMQWIIQWATARITGQPEQHPPTPYDWTAETSIRDLGDQQ